MRKIKILLGVILTLVLAFIGFKVFQLDHLAEYLRPFILPLLTIYYYAKHKDKHSYFFYFLLFFSLSELLSVPFFFIDYTKFTSDAVYFTGNMLCVTAYMFLIFEVCKSINILKLFKRFTLLIIVLLLLDAYTVILVSDVAGNGDYIMSIYEYSMEFIYNSVIMLLLTVALLNYLYRDSNKAMTLLVGSLCIVFSEVIQVAYFYVTEITFLGILYSVLLVVAFMFFYMQTNMEYAEDGLLKEDSVKKLEEA